MEETGNDEYPGDGHSHPREERAKSKNGNGSLSRRTSSCTRKTLERTNRVHPHIAHKSSCYYAMRRKSKVRTPFRENAVRGRSASQSRGRQEIGKRIERHSKQILRLVQLLDLPCGAFPCRPPPHPCPSDPSLPSIVMSVRLAQPHCWKATCACSAKGGRKGAGKQGEGSEREEEVVSQGESERAKAKGQEDAREREGDEREEKSERERRERRRARVRERWQESGLKPLVGLISSTSEKQKRRIQLLLPLSKLSPPPCSTCLPRIASSPRSTLSPPVRSR
eukprot:6205199-Pleurochrysis_carterae.AAC.3